MKLRRQIEGARRAKMKIDVLPKCLADVFPIDRIQNVFDAQAPDDLRQAQVDCIPDAEVIAVVGRRGESVIAPGVFLSDIGPSTIDG